MKHNPFNELTEGLDALRDEREGKITLKKHSAEKIAAPEVKSGELTEHHQELNALDRESSSSRSGDPALQKPSAIPLP